MVGAEALRTPCGGLPQPPNGGNDLVDGEGGKVRRMALHLVIDEAEPGWVGAACPSCLPENWTAAKGLAAQRLF